MIFHLNDSDLWQREFEQLRNEGKRIVTTNGTFDILHVGHIRLLREAKSQGDFLIVGLNSDISVKQYKSKKRPIVPQDERAAIIASLCYVDMVLIFDEPESLRFVESVKPDVHVKDNSYGENLIEKPILERYGGRLHLIPKDEHSTTNIIERVLEVYGDEC